MVELTPKERLVHDLLVFEGLTDGEMAERLGMTERAIKFHVQNLLQKTLAPDRFKMAVAFWRAWSGYDEQVDDAPLPVRRRDDKPQVSSLRKKPRNSRSMATKRKSMRNKSPVRKKAPSKKKSVTKVVAVRRKTKVSRKATPRKVSVAKSRGRR